MNVSRLAIASALVSLLAASPAASQLATTAGLQQPGAMMPAMARPVAAASNVQQSTPYAAAPTTAPVATVPMVQQPAPYAAIVAQPAAQTVVPVVQQPGLFAKAVPQPVGQPATLPAQSAAQSAAPAVQQPGTFAVEGAPLVAPPAVAVQQPSALSNAIPEPFTQAAGPAIQQPGAFIAPATPASNAVLQQPGAIGAPKSTFANYYDDDEEDEGDEEEDEDDDSDGCGDDVGCGDECAKEANCCGWTCGGWIEQGITFNGYNPRDGFNGTVVMNDLANQWMGNQFWLYTEREIEEGNCGWDYGGRVDLVYGTDAFFMQSKDGLENRWDQDSQYVFSPLRFYLDVAYNNWTLRGGRFDNPTGYEPWDATESFFYSRSYCFYAQAGQLLGLMLTNHLNDQLSLTAGLHRGESQFDDTDGKNAVDFVGGGEWVSLDEETWLDIYVLAEERGIAQTRTDYSVVAGQTLAEDTEYVFEWYWGQVDEPGGVKQWYGIEQQLTKEINDCWSHGVRFEWFRDDDGFIINGTRPRNVLGPFTGNFYELTYAINYRPCENFVLRPEVRWDWYKSDNGGPEPFDDGTRSNQFIVSLDAIYAF